MLSISECKKELQKEGECYSDEEIKEIREILYQLARIEIENYKIKLHGKESDNIRKGVNR